MGFSRPQQGKFRPMVNEAWEQVSRYIDGASRCRGKRCNQCDFCGWYEAELFEATGQRSSTALDTMRDFEKTMRHFEILAGSGLYWQMRAESGDCRRVLHEVQKLCRRRAGREANVVESYLQAIARRQLGLGSDAPLPDLASLTYEQLANVRSAITRDISSQIRNGRIPHLPVGSAECLVKPENPF